MHLNESTYSFLEIKFYSSQFYTTLQLQTATKSCKELLQIHNSTASDTAGKLDIVRKDKQRGGKLKYGTVVQPCTWGMRFLSMYAISESKVLRQNENRSLNGNTVKYKYKPCENNIIQSVISQCSKNTYNSKRI